MVYSLKLIQFIFTNNAIDREEKVEGIRRLEDLISTNSDVVQPDVHVIVLSLIVEVDCNLMK